MSGENDEAENSKRIGAKTISKIFKFVSACGVIACAVLKWLGIMPEATIGEICAAWAVVYGLGAGTIDANIIIDKYTGRG
ncbi:MAG: hypothetical protein IJ191_04025 [Treponema sp.]|nr:hypothetical protein [Treponema sp.]